MNLLDGLWTEVDLGLSYVGVSRFMGPAAVRISPFPDRERFSRIGASTPSQPKYRALRLRAQEAMRLRCVAQRTKADHAVIWEECVRLATTSAAGSPSAKRARTESQVGSEAEVGELGADRRR